VGAQRSPWYRNAARRALRPVLGQLDRERRAVDAMRFGIGALHTDLLDVRRPDTPRDAEFGVFSQWGEDGVIQWLLRRVPVADATFIEFGVGDYSESNTRFLLQHDNWRGLIVDGGSAHRDFLVRSDLMWRHDVTALTRFVDAQNVNDVFERAGFTGDIGLLSIDIDGNDYWVWRAIEVVSPRIVVVEFNSTFGAQLAVTIPYAPAFDFRTAHHSRLYFGASLGALDALARQKGYRLVAVESHGANAFFVRDDVLGSLTPLVARDAWVASRFRNARNEHGERDYVGEHRDRLARIRALPLVDVVTGRQATVAEFFGA
jgi:hypothetical protein